MQRESEGGGEEKESEREIHLVSSQAYTLNILFVYLYVHTQHGHLQISAVTFPDLYILKKPKFIL